MNGWTLMDDEWKHLIMLLLQSSYAGGQKWLVEFEQRVNFAGAHSRIQGWKNRLWKEGFGWCGLG